MLGPGPAVAVVGAAAARGIIRGTWVDLSDRSSGFRLLSSLFFKKALLFCDRCCTGGNPVFEDLDCNDKKGAGDKGLRSRTEPIREGLKLALDGDDMVGNQGGGSYLISRRIFIYAHVPGFIFWGTVPNRGVSLILSYVFLSFECLIYIFTQRNYDEHNF